MADQVCALFVYGTLKPGQGNYHHVERFVVSAEPAVAKAILVDLGAFPGLLEGRGSVRGILLVVSPAALLITDRIEGYVQGRDRNLYERIEIEVLTQSRATVSAWTYRFAAQVDLTWGRSLVVGNSEHGPVYEWGPTTAATEFNP